MSIIHEALKKAGEPVMTESKKSGDKSEFRPEFIRKKQRSALGPLVAVLVLIIVGMPVFAPLLNKKGSEREVSMGSPLASLGRVNQQFGIEEAPLPAMPAPVKLAPARVGKFSMSGLIYSTGESYALINGTVVRVGERVGDATVVEITPNEAVLDKNGEKIVLSA